MLIRRLAVDKNYQRIWLGSDLLIYVLHTVKVTSEVTSFAFVVVDAKDESAKNFYEKYGLKPLSSNPMRLCYPVRNL